MRKLFNTVITSQRHREIGYCEDSDFGTIELIELEPDEKQLIVSFRDRWKDGDKVEYIEYNGFAFRKFDDRAIDHFHEKWHNKQGKFSSKSAVELMLEFRSSMENTFSQVGSIRFILIGRTLYERYCKVENLKITTCGNTMFSHWVSISIESHGGKAEHDLSEENFKEVFKERKQHWEDTKGGHSVDNHSSFSYPRTIKWGEKYKKTEPVQK